MATQDINIYTSAYQKATELLFPQYQRGLDNARYYRGDNWNLRDIEAHRAQGFFHAFSIPLLSVKINRILSLQRANRFQAIARGRGLEDELEAEVINLILRYTDDLNKFKYIESEIFQDGLCKVFGVLKVDIDTMKHPLGEIALSKVPFEQFYYDTNARDYLLDDATFMGEYKWIPLDKARVLFPDFDFQQGDYAGDGTSTISAIYNYITGLFGRSDSLRLTEWLNPDQKLLKVCEHYHKDFQNRFLVKNLKTSDFISFDSKSKADDYIISQIQSQQQEILTSPAYNKTFTDDDFRIITKKLPVWERVIFTGNTLIGKTIHDYSRPPYFRYSALFDAGQCWSLIDLAKDAQKVFDRYTSMIDKSTAKNIKGNNYQIFPERLHQSETKDIDALSARLSSGGAFVKVIHENAIVPLVKTNDIRIEAQIAQMYQSLIEDLLGGRSFQGLESPVRQTATEVLTIERNAAQTGLLFGDNLARWKQGVYEYMVEIIKSIYTPDRTIRVIGEVHNQKVLKALQQSQIYRPSQLYIGEVGYIDLGKTAKPLYECELDIVIDNVETTALDKDRKFTEIMALNQIALQAYGKPLPFELLLEYSKLDPTLKNELALYQAQAEAEMAKAKQLAQDKQKVEALTQVIDSTKPEISKEASVASPQMKYGSPKQAMELNYSTKS